MSITDELREYVRGHSLESLTDIADRIDAEHERELDYVRNLASKGLAEQWNSGYDVGFASADDWLEQHEDAMAEHGWVKLPLDADGVPIHIGDRMEHIELGYVCEVIAVGVGCFIAWNTHLNRYCQYDITLFRHYHEPTVEDVLREFGDKYCDMVTGSDKESELFAEYTAKLQLRGDGE